MATDNHHHGGTLHAVAGYLLSLCLTFFYIQAFRDIVISPGGFKAVEYIVYTISLAPLLAGFLNLIPAQRLFTLISAAAVLVGRYLLLQPSIPIYYRGEYLVLGGFGFFFVSYLMLIAKSHVAGEGARLPVGLFTAGFLSAPILHLALRSADNVQNNGIIIFMIIVGAISLLLSIFRSGKRVSANDAGESNRPSFIAGFSIFLIAIPIHFIFQWTLKPEIFSGITNVSYPGTVVGVKIAICLGVVAAVAFAMSRSAQRLCQTLCALVLVSTIVFGLLFNLPFGALSLVLILLALAAVASSLAPVLMYFTVRAVRCRALFLGFGATASVFATLGLAIYLLEHHDPNLNWFLLGFLTVGLIILALASRNTFASTPARTPKAAAAVAIVIALCFVIYGGDPAQRDISDAGRKVVASLYTWYGVPGMAYGEFGMEALTRPADEESWNLESSTVENLKTEVRKTEARKGLYHLNETIAPNIMHNVILPKVEIDFLVISGESNGAGSKIFLKSEASTDISSTYIRDYFIFRALFDDKKVKAKFHVRKDNVLYTKSLEPLAFPRMEYQLIFPQEFESTPDEGPNEMGFEVECLNPGPCEFALSDLKVSRWKHWNEDYHAAEIDGVWYNDPPRTLAAAHHAYYGRRPWPEIAPYATDGYHDFESGAYTPYGYYDSYEPGVVRSQLQLMEKAGIDGVMIMHPHSERIVQMILDTLDDLNSPLQILYYGGYNVDEPGHNIAIIKKFGPHPRFMKVNSRPVWVVGPTGLQEKPYKIYERELKKLREMTGAFLVGDQYVPPKEEMLPLLDGHYYYDTTGLYRARWGGTNIEVAQPDGTFVTGFGHLDIIFNSISKMVHARNQLFIATVIPGFDNVSVHGFLGSPLYDGRPGTIVKRHDGLTYAETWKAAIRSGADWASIVSWNELHEGSGIEPTKEHGVYYVKETARWAEAFRSGKEIP